MKKILLSTSVIALVAIASIGATRAYFSSSQTSTGNTFSTGTLVLADNSESWMRNVTFANVQPGDTISDRSDLRKWIVLKNEGSMDIGSLKVTAVYKSGDTEMLGYMKVSVVGKVDGFDNAYYTPDWTGGATIADIVGVDILGSYFYSGGTPSHILPAGSSDTVILDFSMPASVGNEAQGKNVVVDLKFEAEQAH